MICRDYYTEEQEPWKTDRLSMMKERAKEYLAYLSEIEEEEIARRRKENAILRGIRKTREIDTHGERWTYAAVKQNTIMQSYKNYCRESFIYRVLEFIKLR
jgi:hypothetical protein|tara:strand:+ start:121 stop:423 length:303 start_codon:yes stop_codon:yes gene_type:complete